MTAQTPIQEPNHQAPTPTYRGFYHEEPIEVKTRLDRNHDEFWATLASMKGRDHMESTRLARRLRELCDEWDDTVRKWRYSTKEGAA